MFAFVIAAAVVTKHTPTYANVLAGVGLLFAVLLFSALTVTVAFAYLKKKGVKND